MFVRPNSILRWGNPSWAPFQDLERFSSELNHFFRDVNGNSDTGFLGRTKGACFVKTETGAKLSMEIPGLDPATIEVSVQGNELTLKSIPIKDSNDSKRRYLRRERSDAQLNRKFNLQFGVDGENVIASYSNGILEIDLPRRDVEQPKTIAVTAH
jgi:HSP20 family protein